MSPMHWNLSSCDNISIILSSYSVLSINTTPSPLSGLDMMKFFCRFRFLIVFKCCVFHGKPVLSTLLDAYFSASAANPVLQICAACLYTASLFSSCSYPISNSASTFSLSNFGGIPYFKPLHRTSFSALDSSCFVKLKTTAY